MKTAYIYIRVSTEEQTKGLSIDVQEKLCRRWAEENNVIIKEIFTDDGRSGRNTNRPALQDMLLKCEEEEHAAYVLVQDTDRLARSTIDHKTIKALLRKNKVQLISISQPMLDDSPEGNLFDTMLAGMNEFTSDLIGRKTKKAVDEKSKMGWYPGEAPFGYLNVENKMPVGKFDKRIVVPDSALSSHVKTIFEMYAYQNATVIEIIKYLQINNVKTKKGYELKKSQLYRILKNVFYYGDFIWNQTLQHGNHEAIISKELYERVQEIMAYNDGYVMRHRKHSFLLSGIVMCGICKHRLQGEEQTKKSGIKYKFYSCRNCGSGTYMHAASIEKVIEELFMQIQTTPAYRIEILKSAKTFIEEARQSQDSEKIRLLALKSKYEKGLHDAEDERFIHHTISTEEYRRLSDRFVGEINIVSEQLATVDKDYSQATTILEDVLKLMEDIGTAYKNAGEELQKSYLHSFFKSINIQKSDSNAVVINGYTLTDAVKPLIENGSVQIRSVWGHLLGLFMNRCIEIKINNDLVQLLLRQASLSI